jgi:hypothetical protein
MFRLGALARDVEHLTRCAECRLRIQNDAVTMGLRTPVEKPGRIWRWLPDVLRGVVDAAVPAASVPTLVHVPAPCVVNVYGGSLGTVQVRLLTEEAEKARTMTFRLEGPVTAKAMGNDIHVDASGFAIVHFRDVKASASVLQELGHHNRITDRLVIRAALDERTELVGLSNIELHQR